MASTSTTTSLTAIASELAAPLLLPTIDGAPATHEPQQSLHCIGVSFTPFLGATNVCPAEHCDADDGVPEQSMPAHFGWHDKQQSPGCEGPRMVLVGHDAGGAGHPLVCPKHGSMHC